MAYTLLATAAQGAASFPSVTIDATGADLLVVVTNATIGGVQVVDNLSNTYSPLAEQVGYTRISACAKPGLVTSATLGVGINAGSVFGSLVVMAFRGVQPVSPVDQQSGTTATGVPTIQAGVVTPTDDNELIVVGTGMAGAAATVSYGGGFTLAGQVPLLGGTNVGVGAAYLIQTTKAAANPVHTVTVSQNLQAVCATFRAATGVDPGASHPFWLTL